MKKTHNLILNCMPPSVTNWASPAMSILKSYMEYHGYKTKVVYWNIILEKYIMDFYKSNQQSYEDYFTLFPFMNYLNYKHGDIIKIEKIKYYIKSNFTHLIHDQKNFWNEFSSIQYQKLDELITNVLINLNIKECKLFGVPAKLHQIVPSNIIAQKVKEISPETKLILGGIGTKQESEAFLRNFPYYDYAIWGEGEYALLKLYEHILKKDIDVEEIPHLAYKQGDKIHFSKAPNTFLPLDSEIQPDIDDFIEQNTKEPKELSIAIEGSRGCHWMKCKFCFLNDGYRYQKRSNKSIVEEIKNKIEKYNIRQINFLDNDLIGKDIRQFEELLDMLIEVRNEYNDFKISMAEIISKDLCSPLIKKMALAGFGHVQIGYESPSNDLLKKINKKNTFASNLLFMKWANIYNIRIGGMNVLRGLFEETEENIMEGIDNLRFQRFILIGDYTMHNMSNLAIGRSSRYYKELLENDNPEEWRSNIFYEFLPDNYIKEEDRFSLNYFTKNSSSALWNIFALMENHYLQNHYDYSLLKYKDNIYYYQERMNKELINEVEFDNPLFLKILYLANHQVVSLKEITNYLINENWEIQQQDIVEALNMLKEEYLLYINDDFSEIVSIIDIDKVYAA